ncbi:hypothetical protein BR93DRAFT_866479, partial [Coniochaeta sp. PMI_546]
MSTIASPRDPSTPFPRRTHSSQNITTPTSSTRPSMDNGPRSTQSSPIPATALSAAAAPAKRNRAALREYYNLKKTAAPPPGTPTLEITDPLGDTFSSSNSHSEIPPSELDSPSFDAEAYVRSALASSGLAELLRLYARVLGEMRALDAEKKALVYDNYSKLIAATETIRRMRTNMDPLTPVASTLDPAIGRVYEMARGCREGIRTQLEEGKGNSGDGDKAQRRKRTREVAREVLGVPARLRTLVAEGKLEEARREWELPRRLLMSWKEKGVGGSDVDVCIQEGDAALR